MNESKNDLSADSTKVDFECMLRTAGIAYSGMRQKVENALNDLQHLLKDDDFKDAHFPLTAKWLAEDAERMAIAADMYHTLLNSKTRDGIKVVNKPEIKPETRGA